MAPLALPLLLVGIIIAYVSALAIEASRHRARLGTVPIRVHVNGIRGKTDVARLVGAALRDAGVRTWTKTTGKEAVVVDHRGVSRSVVRRGAVNVREQMAFIGRTSAAGAEAVVVECMAVTPELQEVSMRMVAPAVGVITNVRLEHTDVMGPGLDDVAEALAASIPRNGVLVTGDRRYSGLHRKRARERGTRTVLADPRRLPVDVKRAFSDHPYPENVAVAHEVCRALEIDARHLIEGHRGPAGAGDDGPLHFTHGDINVTFIDALGANDASSTEMALARARGSVPAGTTVIGLFCGRADRPARAVELAAEFMPSAGFDRCFACGPGARLFAARAVEAGAGRSTVRVLRTGDGKDVLKGVLDGADGGVLLFAFGNRTGRTARRLLEAVKREDGA